MHNARGISQGKNNIRKEDMITKLVKKEEISILTAIETGVYGSKKPHIPITFDKQLYNNI